MKANYKYLFGPVPSRRLGRSLGVDLTPHKTCTLDCVFCQLGRTTHNTVERKEYVPVRDVIEELEMWLQENERTDYITLSGSGEPTLNSRFGEVLEFIRKETPYPAVILSNGTLFWMPEVREAACYADIAKLSLSVWDQLSFEQINRPHPDLQLKRVIEGQRAFRAEFKGQLWMEVFLVGGMNSRLRDVERIAELVEAVGPDEIHLNTAVRPPAEDFAVSLPRDEMEAVADIFHPAATIIAEFPSDKSADVEANEATILAMLRRRPCTVQQVAEVFGMHLNEVSKYVGELLRAGKARAHNMQGETYYVAVEDSGDWNADV